MRVFMGIDPEMIDTGRRTFFKELPRFLIRQVREVASGAFLNERRVARIDVTKCFAWLASDCQHCYLACPLKERAIVMRDLKPVIYDSAWDGCGMCEAACRTVNDLGAIMMKEVAV